MCLPPASIASLRPCHVIFTMTRFVLVVSDTRRGEHTPFFSRSFMMHQSRKGPHPTSHNHQVAIIGLLDVSIVRAGALDRLQIWSQVCILASSCMSSFIYGAVLLQELEAWRRQLWRVCHKTVRRLEHDSCAIGTRVDDEYDCMW